MNIKIIVKKLAMKLYFPLKERTYKMRGIKYVFENHSSDVLIVVFSGFSEFPVYNYIRTLKSFKYDKLFLLDDFAYRGSYYMYAKGSCLPMLLTQSVIERVKNSKGGGV